MAHDDVTRCSPQVASQMHAYLLLTACSPQVASHMLSVPPDHPSFTSSIPATDASHPSAPTGNDERCRLELPGSEDAERNARSSARRTGKAAAAVCGVVEGAELGEGDRCSLGFLEACRGILVGKGQIDRVAWVRCAAQVCDPGAVGSRGSGLGA